MGSKVQRFKHCQTEQEVYALFCDEQSQSEAKRFLEYCVQAYEEGYQAINWFSFITSEPASFVLCRFKDNGGVHYESSEARSFLNQYRLVV